MTKKNHTKYSKRKHLKQLRRNAKNRKVRLGLLKMKAVLKKGAL